MADLEGLASSMSNLLARQATSAAAAAVTTAASSCPTDNSYNGDIGARVSAIFVILIGSMFGAVFPVYAHKNEGVKVPRWTFFIAKYFGSGVIIATAFIHLLAPACVALTNPCLTGPITEYDWAEGIVLMTIFILFFIELMALRFSTFGDPHSHSHGHTHAPSPPILIPSRHSLEDDTHPTASTSGHTPGKDHFSHSRDHVDHDLETGEDKPTENYAAQMTAIFILEFGVVFHSIFVGLTLAVAGAEFSTLYVVLAFHQTFEGLGLGSRLAIAPWPRHKRLTPYWLGLAFAVSTPIALAVGLGVRNSYVPGSQTALIVNGVFDAISAGILIYTGLVELMAHEFMFSEVMRKASLRVMLSAFGLMCLGAGLMALLGRWA